MSVADDEQRLVDAMKRVKFTRWLSPTDVMQFIEQLRAEGITITPPPAPEPTYTVRLTKEQRHDITYALHEVARLASTDGSSQAFIARQRGLADAIERAQPDEVTP